MASEETRGLFLFFGRLRSNLKPNLAMTQRTHAADEELELKGTSVDFVSQRSLFFGVADLSQAL